MQVKALTGRPTENRRLRFFLCASMIRDRDLADMTQWSTEMVLLHGFMV